MNAPGDHEHDHERRGADHGNGHAHTGTGTPDSTHSGHQPHGDDEQHAAGGLASRALALLRPHSHDPASRVDSALEGDARGVRALKISIIAMGITALVQALLVLMTGSVGLLSDTLHNFADTLTSVPIWFAFIIGRRAATRRFSYGFGRAEDLAGLVVLVFIAVSSLIAAYEAIDRLLHPSEVRLVWVVAVAGLVGFAGNELIAQYRIRVGRQIGSGALVADGLHARTDGITSLAVVAGAVGIALGFPAADPIAGLVIAVLILAVLKSAAADVLMRIMDGVDPSIRDASEAVLRAVPGVEDIGQVRIRWIGHRLHAEAEVMVDEDRTIGQAHEIAEQARHSLLHEVPHLTSAIIHADPCGHGGADPHGALAHHVGLAEEPQAPG